MLIEFHHENKKWKRHYLYHMWGGGRGVIATGKKTTPLKTLFSMAFRANFINMILIPVN